jgi:hypothetical protein
MIGVVKPISATQKQVCGQYHVNMANEQNKQRVSRVNFYQQSLSTRTFEGFFVEDKWAQRDTVKKHT